MATTSSRGVWADDEHDRFLQAIQQYPNGPWKAIAEFVGTRTVRQVQTHAQKYHEKAARRLRDLRLHRERATMPEPAVEMEMKQICEMLQRNRVPLSPRSVGQQKTSTNQLAAARLRYFGGNNPSSLPSDESIPSFDECLDFLIEALAAEASDSESSVSP